MISESCVMVGTKLVNIRNLPYFLNGLIFIIISNLLQITKTETRNEFGLWIEEKTVRLMRVSPRRLVFTSPFAA